MQILVSILFIFLPFSSNVDCGPGWMEFWPVGKELNQNSLIVIDGYGMGQMVLQEINQTYFFTLKSDELIVNLKVKELLTGYAGFSQVLLQPEKELMPGREYSLHINTMNGISSKTSWLRNEVKNFKLPSWKVALKSDNEKPVWMIYPKETAKTYTEFGCGPEYYVHFNFQVMDRSEFLIKATVRNLCTGNKETAYLKPYNSMMFKIGRSMCGGAFSFRDGENFEVTFDIMDSSGNYTSWNGNSIQFSKPTSAN